MVLPYGGGAGHPSLRFDYPRMTLEAKNTKKKKKVAKHRSFPHGALPYRVLPIASMHLVRRR